ncbi:unnamed protein product, partial [marine sediment metagenome]
MIPLAYGTSPEIFVRSSYGGYFAISNFAVLLALMAVEQRRSNSRHGWWINCFLCGGFLALVNHKLVLLPVAMVVWELFCRAGKQISGRPAGALLHPAAVGFAAGTALFWLWGLAIDPADFWQDHLRTHYLDRLLHHNPLGYGGYPSVAGLWIEFFKHTGYVLLPMGVAALVLLQKRYWDPSSPDESRQTVGLWLVWTLLTAAAFSLVDWRQTKHLMPLMLVFYLAPARWAAHHRSRLWLVAAVFLVLTAWNLWALQGLA